MLDVAQSSAAHVVVVMTKQLHEAIINNATEGQPLSVSISGTHDLWWSQLKKGHGRSPPF